MNWRDFQPRNARKFNATAASCKWMWVSFFGLGFFIFCSLCSLIYNGVIGYMPPIEELEDPHDKLASLVYASDGTTELGRYYFGAGNRVYTDYNGISPLCDQCSGRHRRHPFPRTFGHRLQGARAYCCENPHAR